MTSKYMIYFQVDLLHDYYRDGTCRDFSILPSPETIAFLRNNRMLCKVVSNKLIVLVKVDDSGKPVVDIDRSCLLRFYLDLATPEFMTVTNLDDASLREKRFLFSNITGNGSGSVLNLTTSIPVYDNSLTYKPGDLVNNGSNEIFECIKTTTGHNTTQGTYWSTRNSASFVSRSDMIRFIAGIASFETSSPAKDFNITFFGFNSLTGLYDLLVKSSVQSIGQKNDPVNIVQVNFTGLPYGRYNLEINSDSFPVCYDDPAVHNNYFGVVEIFNHLPDTDPFCLLDGSGTVKETTYIIRFCNRRAYWKYITPRQMIADINESGNPLVHPFDVFSNDPVGHPSRKDYFLSKEPLLLSEDGSKNNFELELADLANTDRPAAPKPDPGVAGLLTRSNDDIHCNIYLNY